MKDYFEQWNNSLAEMDVRFYGSSYQKQVRRSKYNPLYYLMKPTKLKRIHPINFLSTEEIRNGSWD